MLPKPYYFGKNGRNLKLKQRNTKMKKNTLVALFGILLLRVLLLIAH